MTTREEAIASVNRLFDRIEADGRDPLGFAAVVPHMGPREGVAYTTIESETTVTFHERLVVPLLGGVETLRTNVASRLTYTEFGPGES